MGRLDDRFPLTAAAFGALPAAACSPPGVHSRADDDVCGPCPTPLADHPSSCHGQEPSGREIAIAGIGTALLAIVRCATPTPLAAEAFDATGEILGNPWMVTAVVRRRRSGHNARCPPSGEPKKPAARDQPPSPKDPHPW
ncbi:hypothetical protein [Streptomyces albicerus]|uniref:hypothetical protein n=1 Tax=Streptomyces albicerus TaxID=2569859 RepID=UPI001CED6889|nr:hypothetical protein [Streptomyces albicerus]